MSKYVKEHRDEIKERTIKSLDKRRKADQRFTLTFDEWSSGSNKKFLNTNVHHRDDDFDCLGLKRAKGHMPGPKLTALVTEHANDFQIDLEKDVVACVTDGAKIMDVVGRLIPCIHLKCQCHGVNLAVCDILYPNGKKKKKANNIDETFDTQNVEETSVEDKDDPVQGFSVEHVEPEGPEMLGSDHLGVVEKVRGLVRLFRRSAVKNDEYLQEHVLESHGKEYVLFLDCKTRWNTLGSMLTRFLMLSDSIKMALYMMDIEWPFSSEEWQTLQDLNLALKPMTLAVKKLGARLTTLIDAEVIYGYIENKLDELHNTISQRTPIDEDDPNPNPTIASKLKNAFVKRVLERRDATLTHLCMFLKDPTYWSKDHDRFGIPVVENDIIEFASSLLKRLFPEDFRTQYPKDEDGDETVFESSQPEKPTVHVFKSSEEEIDALLDEQSRSPVKSVDTEGPPNVSEIMKSYAKNPTNMPPLLSKLYRALKTIPPSSIEAERAFSTCGIFATKLRNRMSDDTLSSLLFLKKYYQKIKVAKGKQANLGNSKSSVPKEPINQVPIQDTREKQSQKQSVSLFQKSGPRKTKASQPPNSEKNSKKARKSNLDETPLVRIDVTDDEETMMIS